MNIYLFLFTYLQRKQGSEILPSKKSFKDSFLENQVTRVPISLPPKKLISSKIKKLGTFVISGKLNFKNTQLTNSMNF
jgi:hypothetical protein